MSLKPFAPRRLVGAGIASALVWGCIGGTGTDTENGITNAQNRDRSVYARVVDADGHAIRGAVLALHTPGFSPDTARAAEDLLDSTAAELRTDSAGYVRFRMAEAGKYVVEGKVGDTVLFYDTLAVADKSGEAPYTFRGQPPRNFQGTVRLASGLRVDSGAVFVRGTGRWARLQASGAYDLGTLPAGVAGMAVGLRYSASPAQFRLAEQKDSVKDTAIGGPLTPVLKPVFACKEISKDSTAHVISTYSRTAPAMGTTGPLIADTLSPKLDSAHLQAAANACDSLAGGTVVTVKVPVKTASMIKDSVAVPYVAVPGNGAGTVTQLIPLQGCVAAPGTVTTTFDVQVAGSGADLLIGDVANSCK